MMNKFIILLLTAATNLVSGTALTAENSASFLNVAIDTNAVTPSAKENVIPDKANHDDINNNRHKNSMHKKHHHNHKNKDDNNEHKNTRCVDDRCQNISKVGQNINRN